MKIYPKGLLSRNERHQDDFKVYRRTEVVGGAGIRAEIKCSVLMNQIGIHIEMITKLNG